MRRIKQGRARHCAGLGEPSTRRPRLVNPASPICALRVIRATEEPAFCRNLLMQEAGGAVNFDFQDYTEDRLLPIFRDLVLPA